LNQVTPNLLDMVEVVSRSMINILIVGDIMLDVTIIGDATRLSAEAAVPVLLNPTISYSPGGAGAVALMAVALGANVRLVGDVGPDRMLSDLLQKDGIKLFATRTRSTTEKRRVCGVSSGRHRQQIVRMDLEDTHEMSGNDIDELRKQVFNSFRHGVNPDTILVSDYDKGVCHASVISAMEAFRGMLIVDPPRTADWQKYQGVECLVPNRQEARSFRIENLISIYGVSSVIAKQDEDGCTVHERMYPASGLAITSTHIPATPVFVNDVTGAGDQFLAGLGVGRACGFTYPQAAEFANFLAGMQVERMGIRAVTLNEVRNAVALPPKEKF
jgi:D-beta-D-heptose 7-phosphate kinase/D-beta-D-heptose 1-phosphate adenosyltransferase